MNVAVIGMGKIGLPLAVQIAENDFVVTGLDINHKTVSQINLGKVPFPEESFLDIKLQSAVANKKLTATTILSDAICDADVILFAIPLLINEASEPDFDTYDKLLCEIATCIKSGVLLLFETTLPIGTTRNRFVPMVEKYSKKQIGKTFYAAYSPERVTTGRIFEDLRKYPKIVGGVDKTSAEKAANFYSEILDFDVRNDLKKENGVWVVDSSESAEFVKLAETTYRDVNIGLANQFAKHSHKLGLSFEQIRDAANSQPYSNIHQPGIAVGGHCIPVYPRFYSWNDPEASLVLAARDVNLKMPFFFVDELENMIGNFTGKKILILGISYREKVKETAFSGAFAIKQILKERGAIPYAIDPLYSEDEILNLEFEPTRSFNEIDAIIVHTKHLEFLNLDFKKFTNLKAIVDGRGLFDELHKKLKVSYLSLS